MARGSLGMQMWTMVVTFATSQAMSLPTATPPMATTVPLPIPTTTAGVCITDRRDVLALGESKTYSFERSCATYTCEKPGNAFVSIGDCFLAPRCVDPELKPEACCKSCPNGENCRTPSGKVIEAGQDVMDNGQLCRCPEMDWSNPDPYEDPTKAECKASTPAPRPVTTAGPVVTTDGPDTTTTDQPPQPTCATGWSESKGACYKFFDSRKKLADAQAACANTMSSKLATAKTRKERNFVRDLAGTTIWIGGDKRNTTDYVWSDGAAVSDGFTAWKTGEPDGKQGTLPEVNCMIMSKGGKWLDSSCTRGKKPFVCKYVLQ